MTVISTLPLPTLAPTPLANQPPHAAMGLPMLPGAAPATKTILPQAVIAATIVPPHQSEIPKHQKPAAKQSTPSAAPSSPLAAQMLAQSGEMSEEDLAVFERHDAPSYASTASPAPLPEEELAESFTTPRTIAPMQRATKPNAEALLAVPQVPLELRLHSSLPNAKSELARTRGLSAYRQGEHRVEDNQAPEGEASLA